MKKILRVGFIIDRQTHEGAFFVDLKSNPNENLKKCPECGEKLHVSNRKGALSCQNPKCSVISVYCDHDGNYNRFLRDATLHKKKVS